MLTPDLIRTLLPALLALPIFAAIVLPLVDGLPARFTAITFAAIHLTLTVAVFLSAVSEIQEDPDIGRSIDRAKKQSERVSRLSLFPATRCRAASNPIPRPGTLCRSTGPR